MNEDNNLQEGHRCPKRRVAQAAIRLATAVITFRNKEIMVMYLPLKFEFDWTKRFRVRVRKRKC